MKAKHTFSRNRFWIITPLILAILIGLFGGVPIPGKAASLVVNSGADDAFVHDAKPGDGSCADTYGACTLRAAIEEANAHAGLDVITFDISLTIYLNEGALPDITETVMMDASSRWNSALNQPGITIDGVDGNYHGLTLKADGCGIFGLGITHFDGTGIYVTSANNFIGDSTAGNSNVIGGNSGAGISLVGSSAHNNIIQNNYLGADPSGAKNGNIYGVYIAEGAYSNLIGGSSEDLGNMIAGNQDGIYIVQPATHSNTIASNIIGGGSTTAKNGINVDFPGNDRYGIVINGADNNQIGGNGIAGNAILLNGWYGILLTAGADNTFISTNAVLSNSKHGILISDSANANITGNFIGQNQEDGIRVSGNSALQNQLFGNMISANTGKGIELMDGGNLELAAPTVTSASDQGAAGTACAGCEVYICSDNDDEGQFVHGIVTADAQGNWDFSGTILMPNVTALAVDLNGNTSEYSQPFKTGHKIFLPLIIKKQ